MSAYLDQLQVDPDEVRGPVRQPAHQRHVASSATRAPGRACATRRSRRCSTASAPTSRSGCGRPPAPPGRRPTRSRCCCTRRSVTRPTAVASRSTRPTSTSRPWPRHGPDGSPARRSVGLDRRRRSTRYFPDVVGDGVRLFRADLRPTLIFGRHDLLADAPISRVALLVCRNVLMYFTAETQSRILERFAFALHRSGLLLLGRAEMLLTHTDLFTPVDLPHRIFRAVPGPCPATAAAVRRRRRPRAPLRVTSARRPSCAVRTPRSSSTPTAGSPWSTMPRCGRSGSRRRHGRPSVRRDRPGGCPPRAPRPACAGPSSRASARTCVTCTWRSAVTAAGSGT